MALWGAANITGVPALGLPKISSLVKPWRRRLPNKRGLYSVS
jgi:hypothetical protein